MELSTWTAVSGACWAAWPGATALCAAEVVTAAVLALLLLAAVFVAGAFALLLWKQSEFAARGVPVLPLANLLKWGSRVQAYAALLTDRPGVVRASLDDCQQYLDFLATFEQVYGTVNVGAFGPRLRFRVGDPILAQEILVRHSGKFRKPAIAAQLLKPILRNGLVTSEGSTHTVMATLLKPVFTMSSLAGMRDSIARITVGSLLHLLRVTAAAAPAHTVDMHKAMGDLTLSVVAAVTMGLHTAPDLEGALAAAGARLPPEAAGLLPPTSAALQDKRVVYAGLSKVLTKLLADAKLLFPLLIPDYVDIVPTPGNLRARAQRDCVAALTRRIIAHKITEREAGRAPPVGTGDLADRMVEAAMGEDTPAAVRAVCTPAQMEAEVQTFVFAGHDTTSNLVTWALVLLEQHPQWRDRARAEVDGLLRPLAEEGEADGRTPPGLADLHLPEPNEALVAELGRLATAGGAAAPVLEAVLRETLRVLPAVPRIVRQPTEDLTLKVSGDAMVPGAGPPRELDGDGLGRVFVPAGTHVLVDAVMLHRHASWGPDRHEFNPGRFLDAAGAYCTEHLPGLAWAPFSAGHRKCIGYNLALMEARCILASVLLLTDFRLAPTYQHHPQMAIVTRPKFGAPMLVHAREGIPLAAAALR